MTRASGEGQLTHQQEAFVQAIAAGMSQAAAYRSAYPRAKAWKDAHVYTAGSELAALPKISRRLAQLQAQAARAAVFTLADHLRNLETISLAALKAKDFAAAARAEEARGKASGFYAQKVEITGKGGGPIETKQTRDLTDEELAEELERNGIKP